MNLNCLITGVGGQGTVLMSRILGSAAIAAGLDVRGSETIGMAQRGGSVVSHIRMGKDIHSPLSPQGKADIIIAFEPAEAVRVHTFLAPSGRMLVVDRGIMPVTGMLGDKKYDPGEMIAFLKACHGEQLTVINGEGLVKKCGSARVLNTALLGAAVQKKFFPFTEDDVLAVLQERLPPEYLEMNIRAFNAGFETGAEYENDR